MKPKSKPKSDVCHGKIECKKKACFLKTTKEKKQRTDDERGTDTRQTNEKKKNRPLQAQMLI